MQVHACKVIFVCEAHVLRFFHACMHIYMYIIMYMYIIVHVYYYVHVKHALCIQARVTFDGVVHGLF